MKNTYVVKADPGVITNGTNSLCHEISKLKEHKIAIIISPSEEYGLSTLGLEETYQASPDVAAFAGISQTIRSMTHFLRGSLKVPVVQINICHPEDQDLYDIAYHIVEMGFVPLLCPDPRCDVSDKIAGTMADTMNTDLLIYLSDLGGIYGDGQLIKEIDRDTLRDATIPPELESKVEGILSCDCPVVIAGKDDDMLHIASMTAGTIIK